MTAPGAGVVCILGMHRSGTSCLAGSLEEAGLHLGEVVTEAPYNRKGNRENLEIRALDDAVLAESGGTWDAPPATVRWSPALRARRDAIVAGYAGVARWGFKDPRAVFTLDGWREALPAMRCVATFRHPLAVAESVAARERWPVERGLGIWLAYNRRLLALHDELGFPLLSFDVPAEQYDADLRALCDQLGLVPPAGGFTFFEAQLRHRTIAGAAGVPAEAAALHEALRGRAFRACHA